MSGEGERPSLNTGGDDLSLVNLITLGSFFMYELLNAGSGLGS